MDDSEFLKLRDLQEDVVNMRKTVPEEIAKLMEKHKRLLIIRRTEIENERDEIPKPKFKLKPIKFDENLLNLNLQEAIVRLNARHDSLEKVKQFLKKSDQHAK
ncbi:uncharacterized protein [Chironomus tepperi]|uniref:uncharacterized protein n=1 Tax=Chironomus tepperi TaxID=113505 RepID=UPI00391F7B24